MVNDTFSSFVRDVGLRLVDIYKDRMVCVEQIDSLEGNVVGSFRIHGWKLVQQRHGIENLALSRTYIFLALCSWKVAHLRWQLGIKSLKIGWILLLLYLAPLKID